ncbi:MAG TPA: 50S ribosomal protein L30 [Gemmatimonadales bacterium]|nr:50S ribosomal protein L30 [Gemmatimonadales bacterium]
MGRKKKQATGRLRVKQVRSGSGRPAVHRRTLQALGLRHHQDVIEVNDTPAIRGMLFQVRHLVEVTPAGERDA